MKLINTTSELVLFYRANGILYLHRWGRSGEYKPRIGVYYNTRRLLNEINSTNLI